ncbi:lipocalin family protein [Mucilaginibacter sp. HD30]
MKNIIPKSLAALSLLLFISVIPSCKKDKDTDGNTPTNFKNLLSGSSTKAWSLNRATYNNVEECISTCSKNNDKIVLNSNGTYSTSTYTCDDRACAINNGTISQTGNSGTWSVSTDGKTLSIDGVPVNLVTLSNTEMVIEFGGAKSYYIKSDDATLLNRVQQIAGTTAAGKTWKYAKRTVDGVEQTLTSGLLATRFTNMPNGALVTSYIDGSAVTTNGNWAFNADQSNYTSTRPASGTAPALNITFIILELNDKSFITRYMDGGGHMVELYQVPATN